MSYRVIRAMLCDCEGCETDSPYVVQGDDDSPLKDGWTEYKCTNAKGYPLILHACPTCSGRGLMPTNPKPTTR